MCRSCAAGGPTARCDTGAGPSPPPSPAARRQHLVLTHSRIVPLALPWWPQIEVRSDDTGDLIFKSKMDAPVAALVQSDYRLDGCVPQGTGAFSPSSLPFPLLTPPLLAVRRHQQILCVSQEGDLWGYLPTEASAPADLMGAEAEDHGAQELMKRKQEVENELRSLQTTIQQLKGGTRRAGALPSNTKVNLSGVPNLDTGRIEFRLSTNTDAAIRAVMAFAEDGGVFDVRPAPRLRAPALACALTPKRPCASPRTSPSWCGPAPPAAR